MSNINGILTNIKYHHIISTPERFWWYSVDKIICHSSLPDRILLMGGGGSFTVTHSTSTSFLPLFPIFCPTSLLSTFLSVSLTYSVCIRLPPSRWRGLRGMQGSCLEDHSGKGEEKMRRKEMTWWEEDSKWQQSTPIYSCQFNEKRWDQMSWDAMLCYCMISSDRREIV